MLARKGDMQRAKTEHKARAMHGARCLGLVYVETGKEKRGRVERWGGFRRGDSECLRNEWGPRVRSGDRTKSSVAVGGTGRSRADAQGLMAR